MELELVSQINQDSPSKINRRWWDILAAVLLLIAMFTAASRLEATRWSSTLSIVPGIAGIATLIGLAIGQSRFSRVVSFVLATLYGLFFITWQLGLTANDSLPWKERLLFIGGRSEQAWFQVVSGKAVNDSILFIVAMIILFWFLGTHAGYSLTRYGNAWLALLPTGMVIIIIHAFDSGITRRSVYLAVFLFFCLALISRTVYLHQQHRWRQNRVVTPPNLSLDFLRFGFVIATLIILLAWSVPALANSMPAIVEATQPIRQSWSDFRERWENAFASLRSSVSIYVESYADNVALGQGSTLRDIPLFIVSPPENRPLGARFYWRARSYEEYENGNWMNKGFVTQTFTPGNELYDFPEYEGRWEETFEILPLTYISTLYSPSQPLWVNLQAQANLFTNPDKTVEISSFQTETAVRPNQAYQVQSSLPIATIKQLRESGLEYPQWILDRYLQLPETISPRTRQLAEEITDGIENPYDKAVAITQYLRDNITYQEKIPAVPAGREPIDWFLFDLKEGFCNYHASAEVLLLRAVGVPARWSVGYAQGESLEDGRYVVRQLDGHSWPEVYFPEYGWVEFEPTVSQPNIFRLSGELSGSSPLEPLDEDIEELRRQRLEELQRQRQGLNDTALPTADEYSPWVSVFLWFFGIVLAFLAGFFVWKYRQRFSGFSVPIMLESTMIKIGVRPPNVIKRWAKHARLPILSKSYEEINRALSRLGSKPKPMQTPNERAELLMNILPATQEPAPSLVNEYQLATFANKEANQNIAKEAGLHIRRLSWRASLIILLEKILPGRKPPTVKKL